MKNMVTITGSEWMRQLFSGERDFTRTRIIGENAVLEYIKQISDYMAMTDLEKEPLILDLADITGVHAPGLYAPHIRARGVRAPYVNLGGANLDDSDFGPYRNPNGSETRSNLVYATLDNATARRTKFNGAAVRGIGLFKADLSGSDLTGVRDLESSATAGFAIYHGIVADEATKKIISEKIGLGEAK